MVAVSAKTYRAEAVRWEKGWEVHIEGVGVTQSSTLAGAHQAARDYIGSLYDLADEADFEVEVIPRLGAISAMVKSAKAKRRKADEANVEAAAAVRALAARLISKGLSTADTATVLGVTKGRVSQLTGAQASAAKGAPAKSAAVRAGNASRRQPTTRIVAAKTHSSGKSSTRSSTTGAVKSGTTAARSPR